MSEANGAGEVDQGGGVVALGAVAGNGGGRLTPFRPGDPRAAEAGRKGAAVRRAKRAVQRATAAELRRELAELAGTFNRGDLGGMAAAAAAALIGRVERGEVPVKDPADWLRALVDVARLESGEATSTSLVAHLSGDAVAKRLEALQRRPGPALGSAAALAVDEEGAGPMAGEPTPPV